MQLPVIYILIFIEGKSRVDRSKVLSPFRCRMRHGSGHTGEPTSFPARNWQDNVNRVVTFLSYKTAATAQVLFLKFSLNLNSSRCAFGTS